MIRLFTAVNTIYRLVFLSIFIFSLSACSSLQPSLEVIKNQDDPLINTIYTSSGPTQIEFEQLLDAMTNSDVIYLGENHDNTHHHRIQLDIIRALVDRGLRPSIGFEFFSRHQTSHLIRHQRSPESFHNPDSNHSAEKLLRIQLGWSENRDEDWAHLYPIVELARAHKLPVFGADLSSVLRKQLTKYGYAGLSPIEKLLVPETEFYDDAYQELMYQRFTQAHCGWRDDNYLQKLYATWLARNEAMAQSIVAIHDNYSPQPVVMILGAGHTEYNMAVYERAANLEPGIRQLNLRLQAVAEKPFEAGDYFQPLTINNKSFGKPYEYIWFTPRMADKEDPCKAFLKHKNKHAKTEKPANK